jgi:two-component system phosphate regulon sensor histidine kinase PhoR
LQFRLIIGFLSGIAAGYLWPGGMEQKLLFGVAVALLSQVPAERRRKRKILALQKWALDGLQGDSKAPPLSSAKPDAIDRLGRSLDKARTSQMETQKGLIWERDRLEAILSAMVEAVLVIDLSGVVVRANERVQSLLNLPHEAELLGMTIWDLTRDNELHRIVRDAMGSGNSTSGEFVLLGEEARRLGLTVSPTADHTAWVLVFHDMTEQRRLELVRTDFVANVSHELQTPLTAVKGFAETLLASDLSDPVRVRHYLSIINRNSERVGLLIRDLLVISDLELGRVPLTLAAIQLGPVLEEVLELLEEAARDKNLSIEILAGSEDGILGDHDRLVQVFVNLIDNAIKYTASGGEIRVGWEPTADGLLKIRVIDTGIGIPAADLPRLAERFYRVDKARSRDAGGTGLGLSIVRHIVLAHDGSLEFSSRVGFGTEVTIAIPRAIPS